MCNRLHVPASLLDVCYVYSAPHLFVVGTEEGAIQSYSKAHNTQFLDNYEVNIKAALISMTSLFAEGNLNCANQPQGHHMAVYGVKWNPFHPRLFLSCSADWTVKLWDHLSKSPVLTFDLANSVGDIAWSPFSSSVFATVTSDGRVRESCCTLRACCFSNEH